jgi:RNA polymerase sigma-70 factor, ECF subfamily
MKNHTVGIDSSMIRRCQSGDLSAYETIFDCFRQRVYSLAVTIVKDSAVAEDVVQETFLAVFQKIDTFRGQASFETWLIAIAVNQCRLVLRRQRLGQFFSLDHLMGGWLFRLSGKVENPADTVAQQDRADLLWQLVDRLDERLRLPLLLHYRYDYSGAEIAHILSSKPNRVYQQLYEGRRQLRRLIQAEKAFDL